MKKLCKYSKIEVAWLAGLLEGEGCFYIDKKSKNRVMIEIGMTDLDIIQRVAKLFNRKIVSFKPKNKNSQPLYRVAIQGKKAFPVMRLILPLMGERRTKKIKTLLI